MIAVRAVGEYLQFHYASDEELMPFAFAPKDALGFVARLAGKCSRATGRERALDIGLLSRSCLVCHVTSISCRMLSGRGFFRIVQGV